MAEPKTLADRPVADRRGDDALDRHVAHVIDHPAQEEANHPEPDVVEFDHAPDLPDYVKP